MSTFQFSKLALQLTRECRRPITNSNWFKTVAVEDADNLLKMRFVLNDARTLQRRSIQFTERRVQNEKNQTKKNQKSVDSGDDKGEWWS